MIGEHTNDDLQQFMENLEWVINTVEQYGPIVKGYIKRGTKMVTDALTYNQMNPIDFEYMFEGIQKYRAQPSKQKYKIQKNMVYRSQGVRRRYLVYGIKGVRLK